MSITYQTCNKENLAGVFLGFVRFQRSQVFGYRFVAETLSQAGHDAGGALATPIPANGAVANVSARRALPRRILKDIANILAVPVAKTDAAELTADPDAAPGPAAGLGIDRLLATLMTGGAPDRMVNFCAESANVGDHGGGDLFGLEEVGVRVPLPSARMAPFDGLIIIVVILVKLAETTFARGKQSVFGAVLALIGRTTRIVPGPKLNGLSPGTVRNSEISRSRSAGVPFHGLRSKRFPEIGRRHDHLLKKRLALLNALQAKLFVLAHLLRLISRFFVLVTLLFRFLLGLLRRLIILINFYVIGIKLWPLLIDSLRQRESTSLRLPTSALVSGPCIIIIGII